MPSFRIIDRLMDKARGAGTIVVLVLVLVLITSSSFSIANRDNDDDEEHSKKTITPWWVWQRLRSAYSIYSSLFSPGQYWHLLKALLNQAYTYFFPPNIDFRRGDEAQVGRDNGAGEKVKEALAKSLGTSKATLEDAAKSAADIAGETIEKAKEKVKKTLSEDRGKQRQNEL